jgi:hypothetical protein
MIAMLQYSTLHRNASMTDLVTALGATGVLLIYGGAVPTNCAASEAGTLLATLNLNSVPGAVNGGVLTFNGTSAPTVATPTNPIGPGTAILGTATHWRLASSAANGAGAASVAQGTIGATGAELNFASGTTFTAGQSVTVTGFTITANGG